LQRGERYINMDYLFMETLGLSPVPLRAADLDESDDEIPDLLVSDEERADEQIDRIHSVEIYRRAEAEERR
jgi:hypothetical protein